MKNHCSKGRICLVRMVILAVPFRVFACGGKVRERAGEAGTEEPEGGLNSGRIHPIHSLICSTNIY